MNFLSKYPYFKIKKPQNNFVFNFFFNLSHFKEEAPDKLTSFLKLREEASIGLANAPCVANPIGVCVKF